MEVLLSLAAAQQAILSLVSQTGTEEIKLQDALGKITAKSLKSFYPKPSYDQSTRDGYAVCWDRSSSIDVQGQVTFRIIGEVAAGNCEKTKVTCGETLRIMTGAIIPEGASMVIPIENCLECKDKIKVHKSYFDISRQYIRKRGSNYPVGQKIVNKGARLSPDHLLELAESGCLVVEIFKAPKVALICTGTELLHPGDNIEYGRKISGNSVLLPALLESYGAKVVYRTIVSDNKKKIYSAFHEILAQKPDIIITTGGMGPGKYDMIADVFAMLKGEVVYNGLKVRPGKATLFGKLESSILFGLPGPPGAVRLLFHELIHPAIMKFIGGPDYDFFIHQVQLLKSFEISKSRNLCLQGAVVLLDKGELWVRTAGKTETVNSVMHLPPGKSYFAAGSLVSVHLVGSVIENYVCN